ncbi:hypothetical protein [Actinomadura harenae]|uniref:DUF3558 domain-containing protein n=1 Tax=Actinomadura harenae TaxID=2483351 RepID=A0A3M2M526_9ACTN|nr:hypothetical protein [Actinomadura harenae]RMI44689.1 hypothetical protein EBO15_12095 [Actinomadura harenae]
MNRVWRVLMAAAMLTGAASGCGTVAYSSGKSSPTAPGTRWPDEFSSAPVPWRLFPAEVVRTFRDKDDSCRYNPGEGYDMWSCRFSAARPGSPQRDELSVDVTKYEPRLGESATDHAAAVFDSLHHAFADFPVSAPSPLGDQAIDMPAGDAKDRPHAIDFRVRNLIVELQVTVHRRNLDQWELAAERRSRTWRYATDLSHGLAGLRP